MFNYLFNFEIKFFFFYLQLNFFLYQFLYATWLIFLVPSHLLTSIILLNRK